MHSLTGLEAVAHGGLITSMVLVPTIAARPCCAGGVETGSGLLAALSLGDDGGAMGSRFAATVESSLSLAAKQAMVSHSVADTAFGHRFDGLPARVMATKAGREAMSQALNPFRVVYEAVSVAKQMGKPLGQMLSEFLIVNMSEWRRLYSLAVFGGATRRLVVVSVHRDMGTGVQFVGQSQGLITDIPTVQQLVERIMSEALDAQTRNSNQFVKSTVVSSSVLSYEHITLLAITFIVFISN